MELHSTPCAEAVDCIVACGCLACSLYGVTAATAAEGRDGRRRLLVRRHYCCCHRCCCRHRHLLHCCPLGKRRVMGWLMDRGARNDETECTSLKSDSGSIDRHANTTVQQLTEQLLLFLCLDVRRGPAPLRRHPSSSRRVERSSLRSVGLALREVEAATAAALCAAASSAAASSVPPSRSSAGTASVVRDKSIESWSCEPIQLQHDPTDPPPLPLLLLESVAPWFGSARLRFG